MSLRRRAPSGDTVALSDSAGSGVVGAAGSAAVGRGSGGLVAGLNNKLARQRKQLDELISQSVAKKSTWRWYHVLGLLVLNNVVLLAIGITTGSAVYGLGPIEDGSFQAGKVLSEGAIVSARGGQNILLESTVGHCELRIRGARGSDSRLVFGQGGGPAPAEHFSIVSPGADRLFIRQARGDRLGLLTNGLGTSLQLTLPGSGQLAVDGGMSLRQSTIGSQNNSLYLRSGNGQDIVISPGATTTVPAALQVAESLLVGSVDSPRLLADPATRSIALGTEDARVNVNVTGTVSFSDQLTIQSGGITVERGDVRFGTANVETSGDTTIAGSTNIGAFRDDGTPTEVNVRASISLLKPNTPNAVTIRPAGDLDTVGSFVVGQDTDLRGGVVLGGKPTDSVEFQSYAATLNNLVALGSVIFGDGHDDAISLYGSLRIRNKDNAIVFDVDPYTGGILSEGSLKVAGATSFNGSLSLGDGSTDASGTMDDVIEMQGVTHLSGGVTMQSKLVVEGDTDGRDLEVREMTATGKVLLRGASQQLMGTIDSQSGTIHVAGELTVGQPNRVVNLETVLMQNVDLGSGPDDTIVLGHGSGAITSDALMKGALVVEMEATMRKNVVFEADTDVIGNVLVDSNLGGLTDSGVPRDVHLADGPTDQIVLRGRLQLHGNTGPMVTVDANTGNIHTEGNLAVGATFLDDSVEILDSLIVQGSFTTRSSIGVGAGVSVGKTLHMYAGDVTVKGRSVVKDGLEVGHGGSFGSHDDSKLVVRSQLRLENDAGSILPPFHVHSTTGDVRGTGSLTVYGAATFASSGNIGGSSTDMVTVHATVDLKAGATSETGVSVQGQLTALRSTSIRTDLVVHGSSMFGQNMSNDISMRDFQVVEAGGDKKFIIQSASGSSLIEGSLRARGNVDIYRGYLTSPEFIARVVVSDRINERTNSGGVLIEGTMVRDGGLEQARINEINEMVNEAGVTFEDFHLKNGAVTLRGGTAAEPRSVVDLLVLDDGESSIKLAKNLKWHQYYHTVANDSRAAGEMGHGCVVAKDCVAAVDDPCAAVGTFTFRKCNPSGASGIVQVGTPAAWTESNLTHNAYMAFHTAYSGSTRARLHLTDDQIALNKVLLRAANGTALIPGHLNVGSATGVGSAAGSRQLVTASNGSDSAIKIRSGVGSEAKVSLVKQRGSPINSSRFEIGNNGTLLRFASCTGLNSCDAVMDVADTGDSGTIGLHGSIVVGQSNSKFQNQVNVRSVAQAEIQVHSRGSSAAAVIITSGVDQHARLVLADSGATNSSFRLYNDGSAKNYPTMRFADHDLHDAVSLYDKGEVGELHVTGDSNFGQIYAPGSRTVTVQSQHNPMMHVIANAASFVNIVSGRDRKATLVLADPVLETGRCWADGTADTGGDFQLLNAGSSLDYPTLVFADGSQAGGPAHALVSIRDLGDTGEMTVSGDGLFGGPDAIYFRALTVQSSKAATLHVAAGANNNARIEVSSSASHESTLALIDPGTADVNGGSSGASTFEIMNDGGRTVPSPLRASWQIGNPGSPPTFRITDGTMEMLRILDEGTTGDLTVGRAGNASFGGPGAVGPRSVVVQTSGSAKIQLASSDQLDLTNTPAQCSDAVLTLTAGAGHEAKIVFVDPAPGILGAQFEIKNKGGTSNGTLQITDEEQNELLMLVDTDNQAGTLSSGDLTTSGSITFGSETTDEIRALSVGPDNIRCVPNYLPLCKCEASEEVCDVDWTKSALVQIDSGQSYDAVLHARAGVDQNSKLVLTDVPENSADLSRFEIVCEGAANAEPILSISDGASTMIKFIDRGTTGDLHVSGNGKIGLGLCTNGGDASSRPACEITGNTFAAAQYVNASCADTQYTTEFNCITAGAQWTQESTISASCTYGGVPMGDTSSQDACERTGNNYSDPVGPRSALVQSSMQASLQVSSGGTDDAYVIVKSGPNMNATVVLRDTADGDDGSVFNLVNLGNQNAESLIALTDVASNALVSVVDTSSTADFLVSGNAVFGGPTAFGSRSVSVASGENATIRVISGVENAATVKIIAGDHSNARLVLRDPAEGFAGSQFEIFNDGSQNVNPKLSVANADDKVLMSLVDQGTAAMLHVAGDGIIGVQQGATSDRSLLVDAGAVAAINVLSGTTSIAVVSINAGSNKDAKLAVVDSAAGVNGATFEFVNKGAENTLPIFELNDGSSALFQISDVGLIGDLAVTGQMQCVTIINSGEVTLGNALADVLSLGGHVRQELLILDANSDGSGLSLRTTDPSSAHVITFPEETANVLTTVSTVSELTTVGQLGKNCQASSCGKIVAGFGSIVTTSNIETVGAGTITVAGLFKASAHASIQGSATLGDDLEDDILFRGTLETSHLQFGSATGHTFQNSESSPNKKRSNITAAFNPTSGASLPGERSLSVPDIPAGGNLHVVTKSAGQLSNVGHITMDTTAGVIESNAELLLGSEQEESFFLSNRLIKAATATSPGTVMIASVSDFGSGGIISVRASKVGQNDGSATIVCRNIASTAMTTTYTISFAILN